MRFFALVLMLLLAACATYPVSIQQASLVRSSHILAPPQWFTEAPYTGRLVVKRDGGLMGSACTIRVFIDAVPVADLAPTEKIELFVALGEHIVGAAPTQFFCGGGASEASVLITPEKEKIMRIAAGQSGDIHLQPSAF